MSANIIYETEIDNILYIDFGLTEHRSNKQRWPIWKGTVLVHDLLLTTPDGTDNTWQYTQKIHVSSINSL